MDLKSTHSSASAANRIEEIKSKGYPLDFSLTFNQAFEIYKKIVVTAGLAVLLVIMVFGGAAFALFGLTSSMGSLLDFGTFGFSQMSGLFMLVYAGAVALFGGLLAPLTAGFIKMAYDGDHDQVVSFNSILYYYSTSYFKDLFLSGLILSAISMTFSLGFQSMGLDFFGGILSLILSLLTFLSIPLIIFGNLNAVDSILASVTVIGKNPLMVVGLLIVAYLFALAGMIALCIGVFFTVPFLYAMIYSIYKNSVGLNAGNDNEQIIKSEDYF